MCVGAWVKFQVNGVVEHGSCGLVTLAACVRAHTHMQPHVGVYIHAGRVLRRARDVQ